MWSIGLVCVSLTSLATAGDKADKPVHTLKQYVPAFQVQRGACRMTKYCVESPNYPSVYPKNDFCFIEKTGRGGIITALDFDVDPGESALTINGHEYKGREQTLGPTNVFIDKGSIIVWHAGDEGDLRTFGRGWKLCEASSLTTTVTTTTPAMAFKVQYGACTLAGTSCVQSPNYPQKYGSNEYCSIIKTFSGASVSAKDFATEAYIDYLTLQCRQYHGHLGPKSVYMEEGSAIEWESDSESMSDRGWQICLESTTTTTTTSTVFIFECIIARNRLSFVNQEQKTLCPCDLVEDSKTVLHGGYAYRTLTGQNKNGGSMYNREYSCTDVPAGWEQAPYSSDVADYVIRGHQWSADYVMVSGGHVYHAYSGSYYGCCYQRSCDGLQLGNDNNYYTHILIRRRVDSSALCVSCENAKKKVSEAEREAHSMCSTPLLEHFASATSTGESDAGQLSWIAGLSALMVGSMLAAIACKVYRGRSESCTDNFNEPLLPVAMPCMTNDVLQPAHG